jgi:hypothetical protein
MTATMTSSTDPVESVDLPSPAVRVRLKPRSAHRGMVDGAWWPRSRDLTRELPPLIAALEEEPGWGPIHHVTVNVRRWPDIVKKVRTGNHVVRVGWFDAEQDPHDICLLSLRQHGRWDLLVVPPELDPAAALALMVAASTPGTTQTASALLTAATAHPAGPIEDSEGLGDWESEGGSRRRFSGEYEEPSNPHSRLIPVTAGD